MTIGMTDDSLVAKRLRYIERQRALHAERVNVSFAGRQPEGTGPVNRHGMPKLPTGQRQVSNWPPSSFTMLSLRALAVLKFT